MGIAVDATARASARVIARVIARVAVWLMKTLITVEEGADRAYPTVVWLVLSRSLCRAGGSSFSPIARVMPPLAREAAAD